MVHKSIMITVKKLSDLYLKTNNFTQAAKELEILFKSSPDALEVMRNLASLYLKNNKQQEALDMLEYIIKVDKTDIQAMEYLAPIYLILKGMMI